MRNVIVLAFAATLFFPRGAAGQRSAILGAAVDRVSFSGVVDSSSPQISVWAGFDLTPMHGAELAIGYLEESQTQGDWSPSQGEAPYRVGIEANPVQLSYVLSFPNPGLPVQPYFRIGGNWVRLTDTYRSDTPEESARTSLFGGHSGVGLKAMLGPYVRISVGAEYRAFQEDEARPPLAIDMDGWVLRGSMGLRLWRTSGGGSG